MVNYHVGFPALSAPGRQISGYLPVSGSRTTLTRIPLCRPFLVASSLSPFLCRLFFVAPRGALHSASCRSPLFPLKRLNRLGCWSSHQLAGRASV